MHRRQYLVRAGAGVGTAAALAGCLGAVTDGETSADVEDRTGERELKRATGKLNEAALALDLEDDEMDDPGEIEFDADEPDGLIDEARGHLETAAAELVDGRDPDVDTLRTYADVLEALVVVTDTIADDALATDADAVFDATGGDGDLEDASVTVDEWAAELATAETEHEGAVTDYEALDGDRFEDLARIDRTDLEGGIESLGDVLDSLVTLVDGFASMLDGYEDLERGEEYSDNESYDRAEEAFTAARSSFETATVTLESDEEPPSGLVDSFETARCQSGHLTDAAEAFADAAAATASGDFLTAEQRERDGERALEAADECTE